MNEVGILPMLNVRLFGRLDVRCDDEPVGGLDARKVQELLCFVLLHRDRLHCRESLADLLWGDSVPAQSRKYLRQALWQLQAAVCSFGGANGSTNGARLLLAEAEWVGLNPNADVWLDVAAFERAYVRTKGVAGKDLAADGTDGCAALSEAVDLYRGKLLEGWYQDWCLRDRERFESMYLVMLDKLMDHCEVVGDVEAGLEYGARSLACDHARERTYRRLMRLHYAGGDRTGALRVYERCVEALREELGVGPEGRTVGLWEGFRGDGLGRQAQCAIESARRSGIGDGIGIERGADQSAGKGPTQEAWTDTIDRLRKVRLMLAEIEHQLQDDMESDPIGPAR